MLKSFVQAITIVSAGIVPIAPGAYAQGSPTSDISPVLDTSDAGRIALARDLVVLTKAIPAYACQISAEIDPEYAVGKLNDAAVQFEAIIHALEHGDEAYGIITLEENLKILNAT